MMLRQARAALFTAAGTPQQIQTFACPEATGAAVRVRITACTLCGSDLHTWEGRRSAPTPTVLGHEILGVIEEFGPLASHQDAAGRSLQTGDRVTWAVVASCGSCRPCRRDYPMKCSRMVKYGHEVVHDAHIFHGGLGDVCLLAPGSAIVRLPDHLPDAVACPANCATATVAAALRVAGTVQDRIVLVQGAGLLGLTACAMARTRGALAVLCCEPVVLRREMALRFGATHVAAPEDLESVLRSIPEAQGVDVALELTGSPRAFEAALPLLGLGAVYVLVGAVFPSPPVALPMERVVRQWLTLRGVHNYAPVDLQTAVEFLAATPYPFADLVTEWFSLEQVETAFERARNPAVLRVGVRP